MSVSLLKAFMPVAAAGLLGLSACSNVRVRAKDYMQDKPYSEYTELTNTDNLVLIQSRLDSMAYRDIFNGTKLAKDSASVAEFNKIAAGLRGYKDYNRPSDAAQTIRETLIKQGISVKDLSKIDNMCDVGGEEVAETNKFQHLADDWAYRNFFTKKGIMTDELSKQCDEVSQKIRP